MARASHTTVTIPASGTTSPAIDVGEFLVAGIVCPAALTSLAFTFQGAVSEDGPYRTLTNSSGTDLTVTVAPSDHVCIEPQTLAGTVWLKIVGGSAEAADREITLILHRREG